MPSEAPGVAVPESARGTEIDRLAVELKRKEQLISALTERLEQAAEQLDRQNRSGEIRGTPRGLSGMPTDLVAEHQAVVSDLRQLAERWHAAQADVVLDRIEQQVLEIREMLSNNNDAGAAERPDHIAVGCASHLGGGPASKESSNSSRSSEPFRLEGVEPHDRDSAPIPTVEESGIATQTLLDAGSPDLPAPVNFETLQLPDAVAAICERDECILRLRERLALASNSIECHDSPEAIRNRLSELEVIWQEKFRQHELSLSLERARLARDEAEMKQKEERLDKERTQACRTNGAGTDDASKEAATRSRWTRFLGTGRQRMDKSEGT